MKKRLKKVQKRSRSSLIRQEAARILKRHGGEMHIPELRTKIAARLSEVTLRNDFMVVALYNSGRIEIQGKSAVLVKY